MRKMLLGLENTERTPKQQILAKVYKEKKKSRRLVWRLSLQELLQLLEIHNSLLRRKPSTLPTNNSRRRLC